MTTMSENDKFSYFISAKTPNYTRDLTPDEKDLLKATSVQRQKLQNEIGKSKILVVGAGGIGCEVLKDMVLVGYSDIVIIDLDTIDISNLNRQFLFRRNHISKPKALVARQSALEFNPKVNIEAHHDSIFNSSFGVGFFKQFTFVLNALDNRAARNHVNRLCLAANVPLIETGTAGYHGQVEVIIKGLTQCYECIPKPIQKTYPGCTIRNTPSEPVHCIVWSKHLFNQLFGEEDADNEVSPDSSDPELMQNSKDNDSSEPPLKKKKTDTDEANNVNGNVARVSTRTWAKENKYDSELLHKKFFVDDIEYLLSMANLWKKRRPPTPSKIKISNLKDEVGINYKNLDRTMKVWDWEMCTKVFSESLIVLSERYSSLPEGDYLTWDKDDDVALDFVTACANIRSYIFGIEPKSRFDVKAIAGNIIPAIATTNAVISGLAILQSFKILQQESEKITTIHLRKYPNFNGELFMPERAIVPPQPNCYVCAPHPEVTVEVDIETTTLKQFEDIILKQNLNMLAPDVMLASKSQIIISSEEGETDCNQNVALEKLGITDGCILNADDFQQEYNVIIIIKHKKRDRPDEFQYNITGQSSCQSENGSKLKEGNSEKRSISDGEVSPAKRIKIN